MFGHHRWAFPAEWQTSMAFIPVPACVQARLIWQEDNGNIAQNVFYHATSGVPLEADLDDIGSTWGELMSESGLIVLTNNTWALLQVSLRAMNEEEGINLTYNSGMPISGTNAEAATPDQVSYTVTWNTGMVGRSARGRTYGIGLPGPAVTDRKRLSDGHRAALQVTWANILESFATEGHALNVVSFEEAGVPRTEGRKLVITGCNVRFPLATQRRRLS